MDKPITIADVRAHIKQRIQECREREARLDTGSQEAEGVRWALEDVLALLDRVQEGGTR